MANQLGDLTAVLTADLTGWTSADLSDTKRAERRGPMKVAAMAKWRAEPKVESLDVRWVSPRVPQRVERKADSMADLTVCRSVDTRVGSKDCLTAASKVLQKVGKKVHLKDAQLVVSKAQLMVFPWVVRKVAH
jgi:hypothetical protein